MFIIFKLLYIVVAIFYGIGLRSGAWDIFSIETLIAIGILAGIFFLSHAADGWESWNNEDWWQSR